MDELGSKIILKYRSWDTPKKRCPLRGGSWGSWRECVTVKRPSNRLANSPVSYSKIRSRSLGLIPKMDKPTLCHLNPFWRNMPICDACVVGGGGKVWFDPCWCMKSDFSDTGWDTCSHQSKFHTVALQEIQGGRIRICWWGLDSTDLVHPSWLIGDLPCQDIHGQRSLKLLMLQCLIALFASWGCCNSKSISHGIISAKKEQPEIISFAAINNLMQFTMFNRWWLRSS